MHIDLVCGSRETFGSDRSAIRLSVLFRSIGHDVRLLVPESRPERGLTALARRSGIDVTTDSIAVASSRGVTGLQGAARKRRGNADLVIFNSAAVIPFRSRSLPAVLVLREWLHPKSRRHRTLAGMYRRAVDQVVAVSTGVADQWHSTAGSSPKVDVVWNWLEDSWFAPPPPAEMRRGIVFAGRLNSWKGQMVLADAYERAFTEESDRPPLTFVGAEGKSSPFHTHAQPLERRCEKAGWTLLSQRPSLHETLRRASLVIVPSMRPEPFGNVILEALASGCRVMAFPGGGPDDLAPLFPAALDVIPRDTVSLAEAMRRWWQAGGHPQSPETHRRTTSLLREMFSAESGRAGWQEITDRVTTNRRRVRGMRLPPRSERISRRRRLAGTP